MAQFFNGNGENERLPSLPAVEPLGNDPITVKEKATVALQFLRQAAVASRQTKGRPFYSIRTVAKHFSVPATTVTRLYGQLKTEGVLGTIWGSKTIIEPAHLDNDIRLRAMVALPVPLGLFSAVSTYRLFVRAMQRALWGQRFGSQIVFYDESLFEGCTVTEALLETGANIVVWLMPPRRMWNCFARLKDRGVKPIVITDEMPLNGEPGYYLSWQDAVTEGLAVWKHSGNRTAIVVKDPNVNCSSAQRLLQLCLVQAGLCIDLRETKGLGTHRPPPGPTPGNYGVIFLSAESLMQFAQTGVGALEDLIRHHRVLFIHGGVDLPFQTQVSGCFDTVRFDWPTIARRIVSDLIVDRCTNYVGRQTVFKARWSAGANTRVVPG
jgi:hypothetical protein